MNSAHTTEMKRQPVPLGTRVYAAGIIAMPELLNEVLVQQLPKPSTLYIQVRILTSHDDHERDVLWGGAQFADSKKHAQTFTSMREALKVAENVKRLRSREFIVLDASVRDEMGLTVANTETAWPHT